MNRDFDVLAMTSQMLVDRIIQYFENTVMESTFIRVSDIHPGALTDRLQAL
jgi:hypothetical protein